VLRLSEIDKELGNIKGYYSFLRSKHFVILQKCIQIKFYKDIFHTALKEDRTYSFMCKCKMNQSDVLSVRHKHWTVFLKFWLD